MKRDDCLATGEQNAILETHTKRIRISVLNMVTKAKTSHIGSAFSCADILAFIYGEIIGPARSSGQAMPRFILSKGHAASALYATLAEYGYLQEEELATYCTNGSRLGGHMLKNGIPGIEVATGSLGHGLGIGLGMAYGLSSRTSVFVLLGDGECDEGSVWEAVILASRLRLKNLVAIIDINGLQGYPVTERCHSFLRMFQAAGWRAKETNGHDFDSLRSAFKWAVNDGKSAPSVLLASTVKGKGVSFMENDLSWHYRSPKAGEYELALEELSR